MDADDKKKKKKNNDDKDNPFNLDDDIINQINNQLKKLFENMPGGFTGDFSKMNEYFTKFFADIFKQIRFDPDKYPNMTPEKLKEAMSKGDMGLRGPFLFGMNMKIGPDGKPYLDSFGNIKPKNESDAEVKDERDPLVDVYEEDGQIVVVAEVPGVKKEDIELRASPRELEILAEGEENAPHSRKYHKIISLPGEINPDVAKARYQNGILEVKLTKINEKADKRKIKID
jgi:HSP20 family protein